VNSAQLGPRQAGPLPGLHPRPVRERPLRASTCGPARPPKSHRPLDRLNQLAPEAGPFGADADLVAEVLDQVQVGKVMLSWSAAGTVAESPEQDRLHRLVEAGVEGHRQGGQTARRHEATFRPQRYQAQQSGSSDTNGRSGGSSAEGLDR
jgi:hypothetical protein